nr:hypothetical protein BaRGS_030910 [Batillaria attramentaria]
MKEWQTYTCLQFRQATSRDSNRLHFISGDGPDRDRHVTIVYENIQRGNEDQFRKYRWADTFGVAYDYRSIMHYGARDFSRNGDYTIRTKDPSFQRVIGNRESLSFRDIKLANLLYECRETDLATVATPEPEVASERELGLPPERTLYPSPDDPFRFLNGTVRELPKLG